MTTRATPREYAIRYAWDTARTLGLRPRTWYMPAPTGPGDRPYRRHYPPALRDDVVLVDTNETWLVVTNVGGTFRFSSKEAAVDWIWGADGASAGLHSGSLDGQKDP